MVRSNIQYGARIRHIRSTYDLKQELSKETRIKRKRIVPLTVKASFWYSSTRYFFWSGKLPPGRRSELLIVWLTLPAISWSCFWACSFQSEPLTLRSICSPPSVRYRQRQQRHRRHILLLSNRTIRRLRPPRIRRGHRFLPRFQPFGSNAVLHRSARYMLC